MADAKDSKSFVHLGREGSTPSSGTKLNRPLFEWAVRIVVEMQS